jgi:hypothetical protein
MASLMGRTLSQFHGEDIYLSSLFHGVGIFLFSFFVSMALGVAFGLTCSLGLKHSQLASYSHIESCLVALVAYTSYFFSNAIRMSGMLIPLQLWTRSDVQVSSLYCSAVSRSSTMRTTPCLSGLNGQRSTCLQCCPSFRKILSSSISGSTSSRKMFKSSSRCSSLYRR